MGEIRNGNEMQTMRSSVGLSRQIKMVFELFEVQDFHQSQAYQRKLQKHREYTKQHRAEAKIYKQKYYVANKEKYRGYERKYRKKYREKVMKYSRKYLKKYPIKRHAREIAWRKISLTGKKCHICGGKKRLQRHHLNYENPLKIWILCALCHVKVHQKMRKK